MMIEDTREIKNAGKFDVVVVGGGIAGVAAAVKVARLGAKCLLIEKQIQLGGLATGGLISWYEPLCDGAGRQMISGMAEELLLLSIQYGFDCLPAQWGGSGKNTSHKKRYASRYATYFSPTAFALALNDFVMQNGVCVRYDTQAVYPVMEKKRLRGIVAEEMGGRRFFEGKVFIDATGNASLAASAGLPTVQGENYLTYLAQGSSYQSAEKYIADKNLCKFRGWIGVGSDLLVNGHPEGMGTFTVSDAEALTRYVQLGQQFMLEKVRQKNKDEFDIWALPTMPQLRTIRRIAGETDFNAVDRHTFADSIGTCGDFRAQKEGKHYQIPYSSLYNRQFENLLAAGRIISAPAGDGWEVARVIPVCAMTGEAAGAAAALCAQKNLAVCELESGLLRSYL